MAPQRKNNNDDARSEAGNGRDKTLSAATGAGIGKRGKLAGSGLKDVTNASAVTAVPENGANGQSGEPEEAVRTALQSKSTRVTWYFPNWPRRVLHGYRKTYHLGVPSSFSSVHNQAVLADPTGIGGLSPTMNRAKEKRRVSKDVLAKAVRRDFMNQSVNELDVEASTCYIGRNGEKAFRMRFVPQNKK